MSQTFASRNHITGWLRRLDGLRTAAWTPRVGRRDHWFDLADRTADSQHALIVMPFRPLGGQRFLMIKDSAAGDADATPASIIVVQLD